MEDLKNSFRFVTGFIWYFLLYYIVNICILLTFLKVVTYCYIW